MLLHHGQAWGIVHLCRDPAPAPPRQEPLAPLLSKHLQNKYFTEKISMLGKPSCTFWAGDRRGNASFLSLCVAQSNPASLCSLPCPSPGTFQAGCPEERHPRVCFKIPSCRGLAGLAVPSQAAVCWSAAAIIW